MCATQKTFVMLNNVICIPGDQANEKKKKTKMNQPKETNKQKDLVIFFSHRIEKGKKKFVYFMHMQMRWTMG